MNYQVLLTRDAVNDIEDLVGYIAASESENRADQVLGQIEKALSSLSEAPERGTRPKELLELGITDYRQVYFKPYRILYTIGEQCVYVLLIADGRRDMETLLQRRLLSSN